MHLVVFNLLQFVDFLFAIHVVCIVYLFSVTVPFNCMSMRFSSIIDFVYIGGRMGKERTGNIGDHHVVRTIHTEYFCACNCHEINLSKSNQSTGQNA